jgi:hypothetical protein
MAEAIQIKITNADEIKRAYAKAPAQMTKALSVAIKMAVFLIQGRMTPDIPVLTGRLRGSAYSRFKPLSGEVGTNTNYDRFVHEGTKFMPARPYLRSAAEDSTDEINELFTRATQDVLNDIGKSA